MQSSRVHTGGIYIYTYRRQNVKAELTTQQNVPKAKSAIYIFIYYYYYIYNNKYTT